MSEEKPLEVCNRHPRAVHFDGICPACQAEREFLALTDASFAVVVKEGGSLLGGGEVKNEGES